MRKVIFVLLLIMPLLFVSCGRVVKGAKEVVPKTLSKSKKAIKKTNQTRKGIGKGKRNGKVYQKVEKKERGNTVEIIGNQIKNGKTIYDIYQKNNATTPQIYIFKCTNPHCQYVTRTTTIYVNKCLVCGSSMRMTYPKIQHTRVTPNDTNKYIQYHNETQI